MARMDPIDSTQTEGKAAELLAGLKNSRGGVPNILATMAHSPAALQAYLSFSQNLRGGGLPASLREQIALAVAGINRCGYCASAHTMLGGKHGVDADELARNLSGDSEDPRTRAALDFALAVLIRQGWVDDGDLQRVREAGYSEGEIVEIVATVAINIFTNYFNHIAQPETDFPAVEVGDSVAA